MSDLHSHIETNLDFESNHTAIIITVRTHVIRRKTPPRLCNVNTDWKQFQEYVNGNITINIKLKENHEPKSQ